MHADLREFLAVLRREGEIVEIEAEVDPVLEAPEVHRRVIAAGGPALLFKNPKGARFPLVTNLFGTARRVELAFGPRPRDFIAELAKIPEEMLPPTPSKLWQKRSLFLDLAKVGLKRRSSGAVTKNVIAPADLGALPVLKTWYEDGGRFITLPLVYTEHPETGGHNLGMYRMHVHDEQTTGMHFQIGKGGGFHLGLAEDVGQNLPLNVFIGGPPALILSAIAPLPENVPELLLASLVMGKKLPMAKTPHGPLPVAAGAEFVLVGEVRANERRPEGPFGDHYGYYSLEHPYPVFDLKAIHHRDDAVYPATVVGKPRQEDFYIGDFLQELLSPLFPVVMPAVLDIWSYGETGYHSLAGAIVRERYKREAMASAFRILGEGQLALTKFLIATDRPVDLRDFEKTLVHVLERTDPRCDLFVFSNLSMDTLDYTGPTVNEGSKGVWLGLGDKRRELPTAFEGDLPAGIERAEVFCPGALCLEGRSFAADEELAQRLTEAKGLERWPLVVLVDDARQAARSSMNFLWTTFTRFEPAADLHSRGREILRNHRVFEFPIVIDARMKPGYPDELFCDPDTAALVEKRWTEYFPGGMEMGDSDAGHLD